MRELLYIASYGGGLVLLLLLFGFGIPPVEWAYHHWRQIWAIEECQP
jgi:hypothetical protein